MPTALRNPQNEIVMLFIFYSLAELGDENSAENGIVEAYIYDRFAERFSQMATGLDYCALHNKTDFKLQEFLELFWAEAGLRRSIDKVYEIIVYSLFSALVDALELSVEVSYNPDKKAILNDFSEFSDKVLNLSADITYIKTTAKMYRVGVTNASDRGMDMWANFGLAIQIKHLSLSQELAEDIVNSVTADRIVIVCKQAEQKIIVSLLNQIGWKSRIQSIITETDLIAWYEKALRGTYREEIGDTILKILSDEIKVEFPATDNAEFQRFYRGRGYHKLTSDLWTIKK